MARWILFALVAVYGCGSGHPTRSMSAEEIPESCEQYVNAYGACLSRMDSTASDSIERRVALTRAGFVASSKNDADRTQLSESCSAAIVRLKSSCL